MPQVGQLRLVIAAVLVLGVVSSVPSLSMSAGPVAVRGLVPVVSRVVGVMTSVAVMVVYPRTAAVGVSSQVGRLSRKFVSSKCKV